MADSLEERLAQFTVATTAFEVERVDVMGGAERYSIDVDGQHGMVALVDVMPRLVPVGQTADFAIVQAARVSYGAGTKKVNEDEGLIRYLARHRHTTPFEHCELKFHIVMPIFIARQLLRHRTANVNEYSARYSVVKDRFYRPKREDVKLQSQTNRQGCGGVVEDATAEQFLQYLDDAEARYASYESLVENGVSREQARIGLPFSVYTEMYWKIDLHNFMHFLSLRMDAHAQREMRDYAFAMFKLAEMVFPIAMRAFRDYRLESVQLTRLELEALKSGSATISTTNKREQQEWEDKRAELGL